MKCLYFPSFLWGFFKNHKYKIVFQLDLSFYTAIINATQTTVIDQFIALKNRKMNFIRSKPK